MFDQHISPCQNKPQAIHVASFPQNLSISVGIRIIRGSRKSPGLLCREVSQEKLSLTYLDMLNPHEKDEKTSPMDQTQNNLRAI